jgi:hypothetical protein
VNGPGQQIIGVRLGIIPAQAFLGPFANHYRTVASLPQVNFLVAGIYGRGIHHLNRAQQSGARVSPDNHARAFFLGDINPGHRRQDRGVYPGGQHYHIAVEVSPGGLYRLRLVAIPA